MDDHAVQAFQRAAAAAPYMRAELVPVQLPPSKAAPGGALLEADESLSKLNEAKLRGLKPFFKQVCMCVWRAQGGCLGGIAGNAAAWQCWRAAADAQPAQPHNTGLLAAHLPELVVRCCYGLCVCVQDGGSVTAGNSSPITDGACALVLVSAAKAAQLGCPVVAVIRGYADAQQVNASGARESQACASRRRPTGSAHHLLLPPSLKHTLTTLRCCCWSSPSGSRGATTGPPVVYDRCVARSHRQPVA
jgi:acetyl-CoA acetyltransferase